VFAVGDAANALASSRLKPVLLTPRVHFVGPALAGKAVSLPVEMQRLLLAFVSKLTPTGSAGWLRSGVDNDYVGASLLAKAACLPLEMQRMHWPLPG
jgi:hypothetical protein